MSNVQIRNVPEDLHRKLRARAAMRGQTLSEFALNELRKAIASPTPDELFEKVRARGRVDTAMDPVDLIRTNRDGRGRR